MKKSVLVVGAGQIGSRHLQGLVKVQGFEQVIYVLDPSQDSLNVAKSRAEEMPANNHELHFVTSWEQLPAHFDLAIVATGANIRRQVVSRLLEHGEPTYLVLEKVLFQDLESYDIVGELLELKEIKTWVNHPRRMYGHFQAIKKEMADGGAASIQVTGTNWGLGCNTLHFVDMISYITGSALKEIDTNWIDGEVYESKRAGYVEFSGTVKGMMENGSVFTITSFPGEPGPTTVNIATATTRWTVQEGGTPQIAKLDKTGAFKATVEPFEMSFQSGLTAELAEQLYNTGNCELPSYTDAARDHRMFLSAVLEKYNQITGLQASLCPIT